MKNRNQLIQENHPYKEFCDRYEGKIIEAISNNKPFIEITYEEFENSKIEPLPKIKVGLGYSLSDCYYIVLKDICRYFDSLGFKTSINREKLKITIYI